MNYTFIVLGIILVVVLFILYKVFTEKKTKLETNKQLTTNSHPYEDLKNPVSPNFYIAIWLYVHSIDSTSGNNVIYHIDNDSDIKKFELDITGNGTLQYTADSRTVPIMEKFPLQKWTHVIIGVTSGNLIDSYVDGKLMKSQELNNTLTTNHNYSLKEGTTVATAIAKANVAGFERVPQAITPKEAWDKYLAGNGGNMFTRFFQTWGLSLVLTKDNEDQKTINFPPDFS
jgi:hypothetical protein